MIIALYGHNQRSDTYPYVNMCIKCASCWHCMNRCWRKPLHLQVSNTWKTLQLYSENQPFETHNLVQISKTPPCKTELAVLYTRARWKSSARPAMVFRFNIFIIVRRYPGNLHHFHQFSRTHHRPVTGAFVWSATRNWLSTRLETNICWNFALRPCQTRKSNPFEITS